MHACTDIFPPCTQTCNTYLPLSPLSTWPLDFKLVLPLLYTQLAPATSTKELTLKGGWWLLSIVFFSFCMPCRIYTNLSTIQYDECAHDTVGWDSPFIQLCSSNDCVRQHCSPYQQALQCYKQIHRWFPDSMNCPKFPVRFCTELGLKDVKSIPTSWRRLRSSERPRDS